MVKKAFKFAVVAAAGAAFLATAAWAQDSSASVPLKPAVDLVSSYINPLIGTVATALVGWAVVMLQKFIGIQLSSVAIDRLKSAAATQAGKIIAAAEDNLAGQSVTIADSRVRAAAAWMEANLGGWMTMAGATPELLLHFVQGEVGRLQSNQASLPTMVIASKAS